MRGGIRWLASASALACAQVAAAAIPSAANSSLPRVVVLVGHADAHADTTSGAFTVVVRDVADDPMPFERVEVRPLDCPGARVAVDQLQPGVSPRCATNAVQADTDLDGIVRIAIVGGGDAAAPHGSGPFATVLGGPVALGVVRVAYLDLDGSGGLGANDLSIWLADFGTGEPIARADYDGDNTVGASDLSLWLTAFGGGGSVHSASSACSDFPRGHRLRARREGPYPRGRGRRAEAGPGGGA